MGFLYWEWIIKESGAGMDNRDSYTWNGLCHLVYRGWIMWIMILGIRMVDLLSPGGPGLTWAPNGRMISPTDGGLWLLDFSPSAPRLGDYHATAGVIPGIPS